MGRPTREQALIKAIEAFEGDGIPYKLLDPRNILASIAANPKSSESARIRACVVLLGGSIVDYECRKKAEKSDADLQRSWYPNGLPGDDAEGEQAAADPGIPDDEITVRALQIMRTGTSRQ
jgi:hypothetical protein